MGRGLDEGPLLHLADSRVSRPATCPHVLVVDDDWDIRTAIAETLELEGYTVDTAVHGAQALDRLRDRRADLIVLDLMMPVMDGATFIAAKSRDSRVSDIPIIVVTAAGTAEVEGAVAVVRKPFLLDDFLAAVARCVAAAAT
jgi:two-component system chemotaxis response regulator CheY